MGRRCAACRRTARFLKTSRAHVFLTPARIEQTCGAIFSILSLAVSAGFQKSRVAFEPSQPLLVVKAWSAEQLQSVGDQYLSRMLAQQEVPHVNELAARLGMSAPDLGRLFLSCTGIRPSQYLKQRQIECAKNLLRNGSLPVNQVANGCGFRRRRTFFRLFKQLVGVTPAQYRTKQRDGDTRRRAGDII